MFGFYVIYAIHFPVEVDFLFPSSQFDTMLPPADLESLL
jgi:hypothetical protein